MEGISTEKVETIEIGMRGIGTGIKGIEREIGKPGGAEKD